ncbi:DMT family transporter [Sulfitobacter sp. M57]|uniref:DMT family transporter n=1 Tax=unclassified Sulfitobacter TaxID=196795 RepID=UPI0023E227A5|nr:MULTISPECIES: DMT family transporter [unclassified Sulfitobacter]MDF3414237.1 DMT family transporter [Sulfitobacter sp. KE5]MDF3420481.1 DMT family transporter [Sulfitobacter sp. KE43]MDF3432783.1 DMT family transporter [Sulfitobacter sp. KE42]MDF3458423.1 DMT family transporter [Sulfitobacter sp. S74]MDF3462323.1 DMT family transporter [Sulfitobacter sp. Ks18]
MPQDRPFIGITLMLGFCLIAPLADAIAKMLGTSVALGQVVMIRFAVQFLLLAPLVWVSGRAWQVHGATFWLVLLRTVLHILGITTMFIALTYLPLADAVAIAFVMPFFMLILGKFVLNEEVGKRRLAACLVGFLGTLLVIQPSFVSVGWPALLPVAVAAIFSLFMLVTRKIAKETDPISLQAVSGAMALILIVPVLAIGSAQDIPTLQIAAPTSGQWAMLLGLGGLGTVAHLLMTWSLRFAPSATLAPMQYLEIPFATLLGLLIFGEFPNRLACLGIAITIVAGLYVILRERAIARSLSAKELTEARA